jgi:hypothetical protein
MNPCAFLAFPQDPREVWMAAGTSGMGLVDDGEVLAFGKQVIRDLKHRDRNYAGWIMDLTEGERPVGNIPFE